MTCHNMECSSVSTPEVLHLLHDKVKKNPKCRREKRLKQTEKKGRTGYLRLYHLCWNGPAMFKDLS